MATEKYLGHAHNNFLQMLAENGLVGFIGFVVMLVYFWGEQVHLLQICLMTFLVAGKLMNISVRAASVRI